MVSGDQFGEVGDRVANDLPYSQVATPHGTDFSHTETGFTGNWQPLSCEVDSIFKVTNADTGQGVCNFIEYKSYIWSLYSTVDYTSCDCPV